MVHISYFRKFGFCSSSSFTAAASKPRDVLPPSPTNADDEDDSSVQIRPMWAGPLKVEQPRPQVLDTLEEALTRLDKIACEWVDAIEVSVTAIEYAPLALEQNTINSGESIRSEGDSGMGLSLGVFRKQDNGYESLDSRDFPHPTKALNDHGKRICFFRPSELLQGNASGTTPAAPCQCPATIPLDSTKDVDISVDNDEARSDWDGQDFFDASDLSDDDDNDDGYDADVDDARALKPPRKLCHFDATLAALQELLSRRKRK